MSVNGGLEVLLREEPITLGCRKCSNKQEEGKCARRLCIKKMPYILVLQLPRQTVTHDGMPSKLYSMIGYEVNIAIQDADSKQFNYELYGIIEHLGSLDDGHYIAHVLKCYTGTSRIWYRCSDENVTESMLPPTQVNDAYLLFYKQK